MRFYEVLWGSIGFYEVLQVFYGLKSGLKWLFGYTKGVVGYNTNIFMFIFENHGKGKSSEI